MSLASPGKRFSVICRSSQEKSSHYHTGKWRRGRPSQRILCEPEIPDSKAGRCDSSKSRCGKSGGSRYLRKYSCRLCPQGTLTIRIHNHTGALCSPRESDSGKSAKRAMPDALFDHGRTKRKAEPERFILPEKRYWSPHTP